MAERASIGATEILLDDELHDDEGVECPEECLLVTKAGKQDVGKLPVYLEVDASVAQIIEEDIDGKPLLPHNEQLLFMFAGSADGAWLQREV